MSDSSGIASFSLLGVKVYPISSAALTAAVVDCAQSTDLRIIAYHNLHSIYLHAHDEKFRAFYRHTHLCFIDGMSLVFAGRLLGLPVRREHRVTYVDWIDPLMAAASVRGWKVMFLGGDEAVGQRGAAALRGRHPGLVLETLHGFFNPSRDGAENRMVLRRINAFGPQLLMVGMGMPRQEHWIFDNLRRLPRCVLLTAGAAMAYPAGCVPTPPRWAGRLGLEWVFRLITEPRRLWKRYLLEPWPVLGKLVRELVAHPRQPHVGTGAE